MKISTKELASTLVEKHKMSEKKALWFVRTMFETIHEGIEQDGKVKINGLGRFTVIDVDPRESVDVNTGKRTLILGHKKLNFIAEKALALRVNHRHSDEQVVMGEKYTPAEISWFAKLKKKLFN